MDLEKFLIPVLRQVAKRDVFQRPLDRLLAPYNPFGSRRFADPYPIYERARAVGPLFYHRPLRVWVSTGYAECEAILRGPVSVDRSELMSSITPYRKMSPRSLDLLAATMLMVDPPDHTRLRKLVNRAFTPRAVTALAPRVEQIAAGLLDDLRPGASVDVMEAFANRLPIYAIGEMVGVPRSERARLKAISDVVAQFIDPINGFDPVAMDRSIGDFEDLLVELIEARQREPQDDLLSALLAAEEDGDRLDRRELISMVMLLMIAGHETTSSLIGNALVAFDRNPGARDLLLERPEMVDNAIEELIRYDSPVQVTDRFMTEPIDVAGHTLSTGDGVIVLLGAANRDPRRYQAPDELRLDRPDPRPLSFGHGIHHCLGAALARLEASVAIPAFVRAHPGYRVQSGAVAWKRSTTLRGPSRLPLDLGRGRPVDRSGPTAGVADPAARSDTVDPAPRVSARS